MKKIVYLFFLTLSLEGFAQASLQVSAYDQAKMCLNPYSLTYNPDLAIRIFTKEADRGSARSMNALGIIYAQGLGVKIDMSKAISWFWTAADHKYTAA